MCLSGLTRTTRTHAIFTRATLRGGVLFDQLRTWLVKVDNWLDDAGTVIDVAGFGLFEKSNLQVTLCDRRGLNQSATAAASHDLTSARVCSTLWPPFHQ